MRELTQSCFTCRRCAITSAWSMIADPVEIALYFSGCLLPTLIIPQHPLHYLFSKYLKEIAPAPGHHGFGAYAGQVAYLICVLLMNGHTDYPNSSNRWIRGLR